MLALFVWCFWFGNITIDGISTNSFYYRFLGSVAFSLIFGLFAGLPILGIIKLLGF